MNIQNNKKKTNAIRTFDVFPPPLLSSLSSSICVFRWVFHTCIHSLKMAVRQMYKWTLAVNFPENTQKHTHTDTHMHGFVEWAQNIPYCICLCWLLWLLLLLLLFDALQTSSKPNGCNRNWNMVVRMRHKYFVVSLWWMTRAIFRWLFSQIGSSDNGSRPFNPQSPKTEVHAPLYCCVSVCVRDSNRKYTKHTHTHTSKPHRHTNMYRLQDTDYVYSHPCTIYAFNDSIVSIQHTYIHRAYL